MTEEISFQVKTEVFEGPFDLLLKAINEGRIDIFQISISQIISAFFDYWKREEPNLVLAADFLYFAAYLLELKSHKLLPYQEEIVEEETEEIQESLLKHIQEYEIYKKAAEMLKGRKEIFERVWSRHEGEPFEPEIELVDVSLRDLVLAFKRVYDEALEKEKFIPISAEEITLEERIIEIKRLISGRKDGVPFEDLFFRKTRLEIVVTFLAILELAKQRFISLLQGRHFGSILVFATGELVSHGFEQG